MQSFLFWLSEFPIFEPNKMGIQDLVMQGGPGGLEPGPPQLGRVARSAGWFWNSETACSAPARGGSSCRRTREWKQAALRQATGLASQVKLHHISSYNSSFEVTSMKSPLQHI